MVWLIVLLLLVGALLLVAELMLLPGITVAAIGSVACYAGAGWIAYDRYGVAALLWTIGVVIVLSIIAIWFSLRAKTWRKLALAEKIESRSQDAPENRVKVGAKGVSVGRLAPMGMVEIDGRTWEAKTTGTFLDPKTEVEVVGFENSNVIVKAVKNLKK
jgi:membrane-bound ClpP family serine protease